MFLQKWSKPLTMAALLVSGSLYAASNPAVEAKTAWWSPRNTWPRRSAWIS